MGNPEQKELQEVEDESLEFGREFRVDRTKRLDVLRVEESLPGYLRFTRDSIRRALRISEGEAWPQLPERIADVENLFSSVRKEVNERWNKKVLKILEEKIGEWLLHPNMQTGEEVEKMKSILGNLSLLEEKMEMRQFGALEPLRKILPEAWHTLVMASAERQMAEVTLLRRWLREMPEEKAEAWGMGRAELELFGDFSAFLGKHIDQGYLKQMELADLAGGSLATALASQAGGDRVYDLPRGADHFIRGREGMGLWDKFKDVFRASKSFFRGYEVLPYVDVFPVELGRFAKVMAPLREKVEDGLRSGKLPKTYQALPVYLESLADLYSSKATDPKVLKMLWDKLATHATALAEQGCPLVLIPQGTAAVAGDYNKVDIELRLGLKTPQIGDMEKMANDFRGKAQQLAKDYSETPGVLEKPAEIPKVNLTFQPFAHGPNLYWMTRGESTQNQILSHPNAVEDMALRQEMPLLKKVLEVDNLNPKDYAQAANRETALHELAHSVLTFEDGKIKEKVGGDSRAKLVEEMKADTVNMMLLSQALHEDKEGVDAQSQMLAKLGTMFDYLVNKSEDPESGGGRYFYTAVRIVHSLLQAGVLRKGPRGKYEIHEASRGIDVLAGIGREILSLYSNPKTTPKEVRAYADEILALKEDPQMKELIRALKG